MAKSKPGVAYKLELVRNSIDKTLLVTLEEQARLGEQDGTRISRNMADGDLGIELSEITPAFRNRLRIDEKQSGVLVSKVKVEGAADEMIKRANGKRTIPQIFFDDQHIGGYDEVRALEKENKLKSLLK